MKQQITFFQWGELSEDNQNKLWYFFFPNKLNEGEKLLPTIGQMIEFLGDGWEEEWSSCIPGDSYCSIPYNDTLCDDLWKVCKDKLKKTKE